MEFEVEENSNSDQSIFSYNASSDDFIPSELEQSDSEQEEGADLTDKGEDEVGADGDIDRTEKSRTRKRKKNISKREQRKQRRNLGDSYKTEKGRQIQAKYFKNTNCNCRKKCLENVTPKCRQTAFENFWKMGSFSAQNAFLCGLIQQKQPERHRPRGNGLRPAKTTTNNFNVILGNGTSVRVCKKFFLDTYQVSDGRVTRALKVVKTGQSPGTDKRGKHTPVNKTSEEDLALVRQHITTFPAYESHYTRAHNPNRKYLDENINIRLMYNLYRVNPGEMPHFFKF